VDRLAAAHERVVGERVERDLRPADQVRVRVDGQDLADRVGEDPAAAFPAGGGQAAGRDPELHPGQRDVIGVAEHEARGRVRDHDQAVVQVDMNPDPLAGPDAFRRPGRGPARSPCHQLSPSIWA